MRVEVTMALEAGFRRVKSPSRRNWWKPCYRASSTIWSRR